MTLGAWERRLEEDKLLVQGLGHVTSMVSGIASGIGQLGIGGGILLGGLLFQKDIRESLDTVKDWFGDLPEIIGGRDDITDPDNPLVDTIPVTDLAGKSPYEVYTIAATGRQALWDYGAQNIMSSYYIRKPDMYPRDAIGEARLIANWHEANPPPPPFLLNNLLDIQVDIRIVAARRNTNVLRWVQENDPKLIVKDGVSYVEDYLIDWVTYAVEPITLNNTPQQPYAYIYRKDRGAAEIEMYAFWTAPANGPHTWTPPP